MGNIQSQYTTALQPLHPNQNRVIKVYQNYCIQRACFFSPRHGFAKKLNILCASLNVRNVVLVLILAGYFFIAADISAYCAHMLDWLRWYFNWDLFQWMLFQSGSWMLRLQYGGQQYSGMKSPVKIPRQPTGWWKDFPARRGRKPAYANLELKATLCVTEMR